MFYLLSLFLFIFVLHQHNPKDYLSNRALCCPVLRYFLWQHLHRQDSVPFNGPRALRLGKVLLGV